MLGKNDCVTIKTGGTKTHEQKRLVLSNLKVVYTHPEMEVGFSKCVTLHPKNYPGWCKWNTKCVHMYNTPKCQALVGRT
jgi:hypothetical protein